MIYFEPKMLLSISLKVERLREPRADVLMWASGHRQPFDLINELIRQYFPFKSGTCEAQIMI